MISYVAAVSKNGVIGREGGLPWHISSDLKRFRDITMGKPVVMGRKTWESLPRRPLPGRRNIVITRRRDFASEGAEVAASPEEALRLCAGVPEMAVIGGGEIYRLFWPLVDRLYLTEVDLEVDGDTHFPAVSPGEWRETERELHLKAERDTASFTLRILDRMTKK
ncbi:dihydrofolate reductase [Aestuariivirga sp.]|uniref:dihydrofolate reductase n=1 Tax=Aestuariivirga sp. TaxID=2650926 RepID=UPI0025C3A35E|nr:dihydrofolate reductase [Aestuariivirga sp.]MCA3554686.1 dihydrofolate reductase [Aestuariivirga sp.]